MSKSSQAPGAASKKGRYAVLPLRDIVVFPHMIVPLFVPMLTVMAIGGGILSAVMLIESKIRPSDKVIEVPYGVAIAIAGLWALHQQYLNQFQSIASS